MSQSQVQNLPHTIFSSQGRIKMMIAGGSAPFVLTPNTIWVDGKQFMDNGL
jgi:hypothetical protein